MEEREEQSMFKEMGVKSYYIGEFIGVPKRATVMFEGPKNVLYKIFTSTETKPIIKASDYLLEGNHTLDKQLYKLLIFISILKFFQEIVSGIIGIECFLPSGLIYIFSFPYLVSMIFSN